jgi:hypothetical protein
MTTVNQMFIGAVKDEWMLFRSAFEIQALFCMMYSFLT